MMQMHYFLRTLCLPIGKVGHLYFPRTEKVFFSATWLPLNTILGNSGAKEKAGAWKPGPLRVFRMPAS